MTSPAIPADREKAEQIVERLIGDAMSVCEPENADDKATATTRMALRRRFKRRLHPYIQQSARARVVELEAALASEKRQADQLAGELAIEEADHEETAARAEAAEARATAAEAALRPFALECTEYENSWSETEPLGDLTDVKALVSMGDLRRARAVLADRPQEGESNDHK